LEKVSGRGPSNDHWAGGVFRTGGEKTNSLPDPFLGGGAQGQKEPKDTDAIEEGRFSPCW